MKIAFLGNFEVDYCSEVHYKKTFEKLGHEVHCIQEGKGIIDAVIIEEAVQNADMFFWVHTHGWNTEGLENCISYCKLNNIPVVGYHLDLWLGIEREKDLKNDYYWRAMDYFFSVDKLMVDYLNSTSNMPKAFFLPAGVYEDECRIGEKQEKFAYDVIFVGSKNYHKEWQYRQRLISFLETTYGDRFAQYGGGSDKGTVRGNELNNLYASAKIVVGDTLCKNFEYPYYLSDRIFETTGRGGFIIHPYIKGITDLFNIKPGNREPVQLITYPFNDFKFLKYAIDYYLENEEERERVRIAGHEKTKTEHTYTQRLQYILDTIQNEKRSDIIEDIANEL